MTDPQETATLDVAIVGFGPVGQALAALLGEAGHRVEVFERHRDLYPLPRAVHFDGEAMRLFDRLGIVEQIEGDICATDGGTFYAADGSAVAHVDMRGLSPSGWAKDYTFYQPVLEAAMTRKVAQQDTVAVHRGWQADGLSQHPDHVELSVSEAGGDAGPKRRVVRAQYVVGADGGRSSVRESAGVSVRDLGFTGRWVVADVRPHDMADVAHMPVLACYLDPARPYVAVPNGNHHRRWEFMLLDGETDAEFADPERVWQLLAPHISPQRATLVRHAVYHLRSETAEQMRVGRVFLAGDAAHLMPPFAAQGLCCGLRDAACLAWKLDLVLRGVCSPALLDTYESERRPQNDAAIAISTMNAHVACITDPEAAAMRDQTLRSGAIPEMTVPPLGDGVLATGAGEPDPVAGHLAVQGRIARGESEDLFDNVLGPGFALVCRSCDPAQILGDDRMRFLGAIGSAVATLRPGTASSVRDTDGRLTAWLSEHELEAVISRPDGYAFGGASDATELVDLVDRFRELLEYVEDGQHSAVASAGAGVS
jgi:2-polyprenyl-6-methoxyphenol hydroxylase-like FAD-dependent oxidoreductase